MLARSTLELQERPPRQQPKAEHVNYEYSKDEDRLRGRSRTIHRHATTINMPPILNQEQQLNTPIEPSIFIYNRETFEEPTYTSIKNIRTLKSNECLWIDIPSVHDEDLLTNIGQRFYIHPLVLAAIETTAQRAKLDILDDALFLVIKLVYIDRFTQKTCTDQICFYLKENIIITFQQNPKDIFDQIKNRIRSNKGRTRRSKIDYLFYSLFDTIVDQYMDVLDKVGTKIEKIEDHLTKNLSHDTLETMYDLKREMLFFRSSIAPLKEIINRLKKEEETQIIQESTYIFFEDLFDHVVQVTDTIDTYREMLSSFIDFYMMINSNAMNEVMKTLTIISTIFIPLTFVGGLYGMNFENMPEIQWKYGYFVVLIFMLALPLIMLFCFGRKKWF